jgi:hypothetical protein
MSSAPPAAELAATWSALGPGERLWFLGTLATISVPGEDTWLCEHTPTEADAIAIGGNGFRAVGAIAAVEQQLQRPSSALTRGFSGLRSAPRARNPSVVTGYGRLFNAHVH